MNDQASERRQAMKDSPAGVLIDLDGTMADTLEDLRAGINGMLIRLGHRELTVKEVRNFIGRGVDHLISQSLQLVGGPSAEAAGARAIFDQTYGDANGAQSRLYPGVREALQRFRDNDIRCACVTNKAARFTEPLLERLGIAPYFDVCLSGDSLPKRKPDPDQLLAIASRWSLSPARLCMIGDSGHDAMAARSAGMPVWLVSYGYSSPLSAHDIYDTGDSDGIVDSIDLLASRWFPDSRK